MQINTHLTIDTRLCGTPTLVEAGRSRVVLQTTQQMAVDQHGLVHGGFVFGLADHAAMVAVNDPNVVLGAAQATFLKPVAAGQTVVADAQVNEVHGRKQVVAVRVTHDTVVVFEGQFTCFVLQQHVLG